jgi:hypothetical protein
MKNKQGFVENCLCIGDDNMALPYPGSVKYFWLGWLYEGDSDFIKAF